MALQVFELAEYRRFNAMPAPMAECTFSHEQLREMHYYDAVGDFLLQHTTEHPEDTRTTVVIDLGYEYALSGLRTVFEHYHMIGLDKVHARAE